MAAGARKNTRSTAARKPAAKKAGSTGTKRSGTAGKQTAKRKPAAKKPNARTVAKKKRFIQGEVAVILTAFLGLFLFLCNFGLLGTVGSLMAGLEKGLFGITAYVVPLMILGTVVLYIREQNSGFARVKLLASVLLILILTALMQLLFGSEELLPLAQLPVYYTDGAGGALGGGFIGGLIAGALRSLTGTIGAYLILIVLAIICMVIVTEKSFVSAARDGAEKTMRAAAAGRERYAEVSEENRIRREARREEAKLRRLEKRFPEIDFSAAKEAEQDIGSVIADQAELYASYGRELIGEEQPELSEEERGAVRTIAKEDAAYDSRYDTQVLPDPSLFVGEISGVPNYDYEDDSVPFDEMPEEERYKSYAHVGEEAVLRLDAAESSGFAVSGARPVRESRKQEPQSVAAFRTREDAQDMMTRETVPQTADDTQAEKGKDTAQNRLAGEAFEAAWDIKTGAERMQGEAGDGENPAGFAASALYAAALRGKEAAAEKPLAKALRDFGADSAGAEELGQDRAALVSAGGKELNGPSSYEAGRILMEKAQSFGSTETADAGTLGAEEEYGAHRDESPLRAGHSLDDYADADMEAALGSAEAALQVEETHGTGARQRAYAGSQAPHSEVSERGAAGRDAHRASAGARSAQQAEAADEMPLSEEIREKEPPARPYVFPPASLLKKGPSHLKVNQNELRETAVKLQQVLHTFGVGVTVTNVTRGPSVTRYEMAPDVGVKVSRITALTDDIKLALAAADIRIEAPIPGKAAVGIEVPNQDNAMVYFRDLIENEEFKTAGSRLSFAIGKDIQGQAVIGNIAKMPHLLIAGATGSGKSVGINTLIMSLIYKAKPEEVRMIMIDPKVVELSVYNGIPHLLIPVVTDPKKAVAALNWAVAEMNDRYQKFSETKTRNISGYNEKVELLERTLPAEQREQCPKKMPQIVIIIDELAELMMTASKEVEADIVRLAQLARAAGMHLIIATQRPSVDVITGLIKANVPSRIAFKTSSGVDSRTILDMVGAETLLGNGDMLYYPSGAKKPLRVQGAYVADEEVEAVVQFLTQQGNGGYEAHIDEMISRQTGQNADGGAGAAGAGGDGRDAYFADAARLIVDKQKASIGMLQRMYKIGFNRAARIMDQLSEAGVVGEEDGTKPRKVLMTAAELEAFLTEEC